MRTAAGRARMPYNISMVFKILADIVVVVHFLWILFLIFGAFLGVRNKAAMAAHISGLFFAFTIQIFDWYCPLTDLEVWLRQKQAAGLPYKGSFIVHYLEAIIYVEVPRLVVIGLTLALCIFNAWVYLRDERRKDTDGCG
jgi:hypothetical protein